MSDQPDDKTPSIAEQYASALETGEPMITSAMNDIVRCVVAPTGEALIDFVFAQSPDGRDIVSRLVLSKYAAQFLKSVLVESAEIPSTAPIREPRTTN